MQTWRSYFDNLLNVENEWDRTLTENKIKGQAEFITTEDVIVALKTKNGKAAGPSGLTVEMLKARGVRVAESLAGVCSSIVSSGKVPDSWCLSEIVPIF